ncbi:MAG: deoxyribonuclease IV [Fimbriimonadaceae bacterium]|nr:deoxyribonuclease IV [Fimbriimonadaceae bacterium]
MLLGAHRATAGGRHRAFESGQSIGCGVIQIFTSSPRQWKANPVTAADQELWFAAWAESAVELVVAHDSYLINLAASDAELREKSSAAFTAELERATALEIPYLVTHPGAHVGAGEAAGLETFAAALRRIYETRDWPVTTLLETTAGQGTSLGWQIEQLGWLLRRLDLDGRVAVCLDTCHLFAAGYDLRDATAYGRLIDLLAAEVGLPAVKVIHLNDSKGKLGSRVDRHEQIGQGELGDAAFARLLADPRLEAVPLLVETPDLDLHGDNLKHLRRLRWRARRGEETVVE